MFISNSQAQEILAKTNSQIMDLRDLIEATALFGINKGSKWLELSDETIESQQRSLEQRAIDHADLVAGNDDIAFVRELRSKFFAEQNKITHDLSTLTWIKSLHKW